MIGKRIFDIVFSLFGILCVLIPGLIISLLIMFGSGGGAFYLQERIGRHGRPFRLIKFRTMYRNSDRKGLLTVGATDNRITRIGRFLRKTKLDELPQLINIFTGKMSFVGPRPEVAKYVAMYNDDQLKVLSVRPGLTDYASIEYINENELLAEQAEPEKYYIETVMPHKLELNMKYIQNMSFSSDLKIIFKTLFSI